ncbi:hypothetical protein BV210_00550 [Halorientalis sp. IM1011]|jgi:predicted DNA binding protein|uniref:helix-turn-helix domain-containing protein n=1 Tax=Halorientalis sp. IM1011 TaxID=1932360 RepID=UPI00097CD532|nr:helix-turn-helix domain-containing protein [Halorientalis sp. IM1011]AQL41292.1 hypothetical protein BV210_00550 [Halorientalis sp. IM1011]
MTTANDGTADDPEQIDLDLLRSALREGYFGAPREISLVELADRNGMSDREASVTLRRTLDRVLCEVVLAEEP